MRRPRANQRGIGMAGLLLVVVLVTFFLTLIVKLGPIYASDWTLRSILKGVAESPEPITGGRTGILDTIARRMDVNQVGDLEPGALKVTRGDDGAYEIRVAYERREHLFFNVDAVVTFDHQVRVRAE